MTTVAKSVWFHDQFGSFDLDFGGLDRVRQVNKIWTGLGSLVFFLLLFKADLKQQTDACVSVCVFS